MKLITNMKILKCHSLLNWRTRDHGVPHQGIMMSSQAHFESDKQAIIWSYKIRTVGWMWHHCPSKTYDGLCGAHLCGLALSKRSNTADILSDELCKREPLHFFVFQYSSRSSLLFPFTRRSRKQHISHPK